MIFVVRWVFDITITGYHMVVIHLPEHRKVDGIPNTLHKIVHSQNMISLAAWMTRYKKHYFAAIRQATATEQ